jgi:hypothetical protein
MSQPMVAAGLGIGGSFVMFGLLFLLICCARKVRRKRRISSVMVAYSSNNEPKTNAPTAMASTSRRFPLARPKWGVARGEAPKEDAVVVRVVDDRESAPPRPSPRRPDPRQDAPSAPAPPSVPKPQAAPLPPLPLPSTKPAFPSPKPAFPSPKPAAAPKQATAAVRINVIETKAAPVPTAAGLEKYSKMLRIGLSLEAVRHAMERDGVDPSSLPV